MAERIPKVVPSNTRICCVLNFITLRTVDPVIKNITNMYLLEWEVQRLTVLCKRQHLLTLTTEVSKMNQTNQFITRSSHKC